MSMFSLITSVQTRVCIVKERGEGQMGKKVKLGASTAYQ